MIDFPKLAIGHIFRLNFLSVDRIRSDQLGVNNHNYDHEVKINIDVITWDSCDDPSHNNSRDNMYS